MDWWSVLLEFLFPTPTICVLCGTKMDQLGYCMACRNRYEKKSVLYGQCQRCGTFGLRAGVCDTCRDWPAYYSMHKALWPYQDEVQESIALFKYRGEPWRAPALAEALKPLLPPDTTHLVPVPLHSRRFRERGYNQSTLLCRQLGKLTGLSVKEQALLRVVDTPHQVGLSRRERRENLARAFAKGKDYDALYGHVVLVDDVLTTGTTLRYCMKALHKSPATRLSSVSLAAGVR